MEKKIALVTDSTADLSREMLDELNIKFLPLKIIYKEEQYQDRIDIEPEEVCRKMDEEIPTTSMPSPGEIEELYRKLKAEGYKKIISIHISSGLSATYSNCRMVAEQMKDMEIAVIDSKMLSMGLGRLVLYAQKLISEGEKSFAEIVEMVEAKKEEIDLFFIVDTLKYLKEGGRIGKVQGTLAELFNIKPIISIDEDGEYFNFDKVRRKKRALKKMFEIAKNRLKEGSYFVDVMHAAAEKEAEKLYNKFAELSNVKESILGEISPAMIVHAGPGLIGVVITRMF
ncbi:DegV family protein with EDD domain [Halanaerobium sp. DL-01]|uniref:DegV family protein n=1 Tax=Halanaerobium sp. DL-01 TaxID=1653064 RepID=UPI000DF301E9|nr:DegV family protein [Halanaerobium sp. DL-01]RCW86566.1 DegV family protein with EDD domain [Halanaerobium sp. DL-01]